MTPKQYEKMRITTDLVVDRDDPIVQKMYYALGLGGESGEVQEKIKKLYRDSNGSYNGVFVAELEKELGDVIWYIVGLANSFGIPFNDILETNIKKLQDRKNRGKINGNGDNR